MLHISFNGNQNIFIIDDIKKSDIIENEDGNIKYEFYDKAKKENC